MRQKAGRFSIALAPGGVNSPAGRDSAIDIVVFRSASVARLSQVAPAQATRPARVMTRTIHFMDQLSYLFQRNSYGAGNDQQSTNAPRQGQAFSQEERSKEDDQSDTELIDRGHS